MNVKPETDAVPSEPIDDGRGPIRRSRKHLISWATGRSGALGKISDDAVSTIVLESAAQLDAVLDSDLIGTDSGVFAPGELSISSDRCFSHSYEGSLGEPGADLSIAGDFFVETQEYAASSYMVIMGPTFMRITCAEDMEAFLADADAAVTSGEFSAVLTHPYVMLADEEALGRTGNEDGPQLRIYVDDGGSVRAGPFGSVIGEVSDGLAGLKETWNQLLDDAGAPALGDALAQFDYSEALGSRPWLSRYLEAVDAVRDLTIRGVAQPRVSGFGGRRVSGLENKGPQSSGTPILLWDDTKAFVRLPIENRTIELDINGADALESLLVCQSIDEASEYADRGSLDQLLSTFSNSGISLAPVSQS